MYVHIQGGILNCNKRMLSSQGRSLPSYRQEISFQFDAALEQIISVNDSIFWDIDTMSTVGKRPGSTTNLSGLPKKISLRWTPVACGREAWDRGGCVRGMGTYKSLTSFHPEHN